jgi:hypothetical protein
MVMRILRLAAASPLAVGLGLTLGTVFSMSGPYVAGVIADEYDARFPVWREVEAEIQERRADAVVIEMSGRKARECRFIRINAQTVHPDGMRNATISRVDTTEHGATRPIGRQTIGFWVVVPVTATARQIVVTVEHLCGDRLVLGRFATLALSNNTESE